jgi:hypothetical protein
MEANYGAENRGEGKRHQYIGHEANIAKTLPS